MVYGWEIMMNNNNNESFKALKLERDKTVSNRVPSEYYEQLKDILRKERKEIGDWLVEKIYDEVRTHGDGNPVYTLDQFYDENFLATPAYHRPIETWENYLLKCSNREWREWCNQLQNLINLERRIIDRR